MMDGSSEPEKALHAAPVERNVSFLLHSAIAELWRPRYASKPALCPSRWPKPNTKPANQDTTASVLWFSFR